VADPELEAFFSAGEEGTYEGGPGHSLSPLTLEGRTHGLDDDGVLPPLTVAQLQRRDGFRRKVTALVSGLAVASVLALGVHAVRGPGDALASPAVRADAPAMAAPTFPEAAPVVAAQPVVEVPAVEPQPIPDSVLAVAAAPVPLDAPEARDVPDVPEPVTPKVVDEKPASTTTTASRRAPRAPRLVRPRPAPDAESRSSVGAPPSGHAPPSVSFPD
jgi:hypothetical protein